MKSDTAVTAQALADSGMSAPCADALASTMVTIQAAVHGRRIHALVVDTHPEPIIEVWLTRLTSAQTHDYAPEPLYGDSVIVVEYDPGLVAVETIHSGMKLFMPGVYLYRIICRCCTGLAAVNVCGYCSAVDDHVSICPSLVPDVPKSLDSRRLVAHREWARGYTVRQEANTPVRLELAMLVYQSSTTSALWRMGFDASEFQNG